MKASDLLVKAVEAEGVRCKNSSEHKLLNRRITDLNTGQGLAANITTAGLVLFASNLGVPVSRTHVSCGSIFGIGVASRQCRWRTVSGILATWITTLPAAAIFSGLLYLLLA